jgi:hypothetical protein
MNLVVGAVDVINDGVDFFLEVHEKKVGARIV